MQFFKLIPRFPVTTFYFHFAYRINCKKVLSHKAPTVAGCRRRTLDVADKRAIARRCSTGVTKATNCDGGTFSIKVPACSARFKTFLGQVSTFSDTQPGINKDVPPRRIAKLGEAAVKGQALSAGFHVNRRTVEGTTTIEQQLRHVRSRRGKATTKKRGRDALLRKSLDSRIPIK